jgi:hypothetical protein
MTQNMHPMASMDAGDTAKLCTATYCQLSYRMLIRALVTKLPGFLFTGYANPLLTPEAVTSWNQV